MVYVHLAEGFEEIEALTIIDILRRGEIDAKSISIMKDKLVIGAHGITVKADLLFEETDYEACEMIVLPGGMPGSANLGAHEGLVKHLHCFAENDKYLAAICAAPMVLGAEGLLKGKNATIYAGMEEHLQGGMYSSDKVVVDGKIITSRGPATAMPFALKLVELLKGKEVADGLAADLLWDIK